MCGCGPWNVASHHAANDDARNDVEMNAIGLVVVVIDGLSVDGKCPIRPNDLNPCLTLEDDRD